mgnify:CR=1 FL=1
MLTSSLAIGKAYDATVRWRTERHATTTHEGGDMPFVCECDDSYLSDVTTFPLSDEDVAAALDAAAGGDVEEGCVGAGTGTQCMDFKGGIGTSSRTIPGGWTVGVLVLTNFGERELLRIDGVPVGREITDLMPSEHTEGSAIVVVATDVPMVPHQLRRLAARGGLGLARCGSTGHNGSGELMIAFSTANRIPLESDDGTVPVRAVLDGPVEHSPDVFNPLFAATTEAVEEAVVNAAVHRRDDRGARRQRACTRCRSSGPWTSSPATGAGLATPAESQLSRSKRAGSNGAGSKGGSAPRTSAATSSALPAPRITPSEPCPVATNSPRAPTRAGSLVGRDGTDARTTSRGRARRRARAPAGPPAPPTILGTSRSNGSAANEGSREVPVRTEPSGAGWIIGETSRVSPASPNSRIDNRSSPGSLAVAGSRPASRRRAPLWIQWRNSGRSGAAWTSHPRADGDRERDAEGRAIAGDHGPAASTTVSAPTMPSSVTTPVTRSPRATSRRAGAW